MKTGRWPSQEERFWSKIKKGPGCWEWLGYRNKKGWYGRCVFNGKEQLAHRVSWQISFGKIMVGMVVMHNCDNPLCVNPNHLSLGTQKDNIQDMFRKKRNNSTGVKGDKNGSRTHPESLPRGDDHWTRKNPNLVNRGSRVINSKLTEHQIFEIRALRKDKKMKQCDIGLLFGVSSSQVNRILNGKRWGHI